ncbi:MAG: alanine dehydrogenase [Rickettsiales bacterium]
MKVGTVKEIKTHEYRVGLVPASVRELVHHGHQVIVETDCGAGIGFDDDAYRQAGAEVLPAAAEVFAAADMIVKVKEPQPVECAMLREGQILFTYLHLAADETLTRALADTGATCIAYETVTDRHGHLPLLVPMSEVAGHMSIQVGAHYLEKESGGAGVLLSGVPGVLAARVCVVGGGVAGGAAARIAMGFEAKVTVLDRSLPRLDELDWRYGAQLTTVFSTVNAVERDVTDADLVIGSVLVPGAAAPKVVTEEMIKAMRPGSVVVDIAIDQGGCFETSRPTSHSDPVYTKHGVIHYCVTNMPGAVAQTSTFALNNATLPYTLKLADRGWQDALSSDPGFLEGLNVHAGKVTYQAVAEAVGMDFTPAAEMVAG